MSTAPAGIPHQAQHLVDTARVLPADEGAQALEQAVTMLQAAQAELLVNAERSGELKDSGSATVRTFAATILRRGVNDASRVSRLARHLVDFPALAKAYAAGLAHTGNLHMIFEHLGTCGLEVLQAHEPALVDLATRAGPGEIKQFCQLLADLNHPERDQHKVKTQGGRMVRIARVGDLAHLDAMLDPVVADQLKATLAAMAKAARRAEAGLRPADPNPPNYPERCADALEQILRRGMDATDLPEQARRRPHAHVSVQLETLLGMGGSGRAVLHRFGLIPTATASRVACDAVVRLIVKHGDRVLNVGVAQRVVTDRQHAALADLYRTCVVPGCVVRFADCAIHHLWWWSLGGPTDLDLQVPLCGSHHRWLHEGGYTITREHGLLVFRDPKGRVVANTRHILDQQLDLLNQPRTGLLDPPSAPAGRAEQVLHDLSGWPDSPYRHGHWGWTGHDPAPPPGHAPPR